MTKSHGPSVRWPETPRLRARTVVTLLRPHVSRERRAFLHGGYASSGLAWMGVPVPAMRRVLRDVRMHMRDAPPRDVLALARALADTGVIEARQVGYELAGGRADVMATMTPAQLKRLGRGNDNWAAVDGVAASLSGPAWVRGRVTDADVRRWASAPDPWWQRTALVSTVSWNLRSRGGRGDARRTLMICRRFAATRDPMLAKALSWALRTLVPLDAAAVRTFLRTHRATLPALVVREVSTKLATGRKSRRATGQAQAGMKLAGHDLSAHAMVV